jgi:carboxyl-terminal processing protease
VGESTLQHALAWDRIPAQPHRIYYDLRPALPDLQKQHEQRAKADPDFSFLQSQLAFAETERQQTRLSLNEEVRKRKQETDKAQQLALENQRRVAKGEKPLEKLEDNKPGMGDDESVTPKPRDKNDKEVDPLLTEAGHVLIDALPVYQRPSFANRYY